MIGYAAMIVTVFLSFTLFCVAQAEIGDHDRSTEHGRKKHKHSYLRSGNDGTGGGTLAPILNNNPTDAWLSQCPDKTSSCCKVWQNFVIQSDQTHQAFLSGQAENISNIYAHDMFEPSWNCEVKSRVPTLSGDGPKWMCGAEFLKSDALVYSFGSNGDTSFERAINNITKTTNIFIFDPTLTSFKRKKVHSEVPFRLTEVGLLGKNSTGFKVKRRWYPARSLPDHMAQLGHTGATINVLKVDIEYSEYAAFKDVVVGECAHADVLIDQLLIEVHGIDRVQLVPLFDQFEKCNLRLFSKERNGWGCSGYLCVEYSFVAPSFAFDVFRRTHLMCPTVDGGGGGGGGGGGVKL